ncbi:plasmid stabilization protein, partial [Nocardioides sp. NPDC006303]|uniref:plasmid stabilization protein n=1 Tax=Nocardioides sp. NPDC006303 TaxID=3156747 RepID=UPI0033AF29F7
MPQRAWSKKRERQYEHVKEGLLERGENEDTAEEIAARTVNKERARGGESRRLRDRVGPEDLVGSGSGGERDAARHHDGGTAA